MKKLEEYQENLRSTSVTCAYLITVKVALRPKRGSTNALNEFTLSPFRVVYESTSTIAVFKTIEREGIKILKQGFLLAVICV